MLKMEGREPEPLIAAYSRKVLPSLKKSLENGMRKLKNAIPEDMAETVTEQELAERIPGLSGKDLKKAFKNYNTQEELKELYD